MSLFTFSDGLAREQFNALSSKLDQLIKGASQQMSKITDLAAQEQSDFAKISTSLDGIITGITALDKLITDLRTNGSTLSADDLAALDAIRKASGDLVAKAAAISTDAPPVTPPTV